MRQGLIIHTAPDGATTVAAGPDKMSVIEAAYTAHRAALEPRAVLRLIDLERGTVKSYRQTPNVGQSESIPTHEGDSEDPTGRGPGPESPAPSRRSRKLTGIG